MSVTLGLIIILGAAATIITWPLLWRRGQSPWGRCVYDIGVRRFGVTGAVLFTIIITLVELRRLTNLGDPDPWAKIIILLAICVAMLPVWLWGGYWWGRIVAAHLGVEREPHLSKDSPPSNNRLQRAGEE
jgi:hypothetical protein